MAGVYREPCPHCGQMMSRVIAPGLPSSAGGKAVLAKYGIEHFARIGAKGGRPPRPRATDPKGNGLAGRPRRGVATTEVPRALA